MKTKEELRTEKIKERKAMSKDVALEKSKAIEDLFLSNELYKDAKVIMAYMPISNEVGTEEIIKSAQKDGKKIVLPITEPKTKEITPYFAFKDTIFKKGTFGISEPTKTQKAEISEVDLVLFPGVAFSKNGQRIGFGAGCYDKLLKGFKGVKIGMCYDFQIADGIPSAGHDIKMDFLITESGFHKCSGK
jgi:5-formyltetrahydrofolate cyclo-ligase